MSTSNSGPKPQGFVTIHSGLAEPLNRDVILVSVDVENHCTRKHGTDALTEIGMAWLDTRMISSISPGDRGRNWFPFIRYHHWRISDLDHIHLKEFCTRHWHKGDSCQFRFAKSEWVSLNHLPARFNAFMGNLSLAPNGEERKLVPVTFAAGLEEKTFEMLHLDLFDRSNSLPCVDTQITRPGSLWTAQMGSRAQRPSLTTLTLDLGLASEDWMNIYAHNGGNDAAITLQVFIAGRLLTEEQQQAFGGYSKSSSKKHPDCLALLPPTWPATAPIQEEIPRGISKRDVEEAMNGRGRQNPGHNSSAGPSGRSRSRGRTGPPATVQTQEPSARQTRSQTRKTDPDYQWNTIRRR